jgi:hypothetical protein
MAMVMEQQPSQQSQQQTRSDDDFPLKFCTVCASNQNRFVPTRFAYPPLYISLSPRVMILLLVYCNLLRRAAAGMELRKNECVMMKMSIRRNYTNHDDDFPGPVLRARIMSPPSYHASIYSSPCPAAALLTLPARVKERRAETSHTDQWKRTSCSRWRNTP